MITWVNSKAVELITTAYEDPLAARSWLEDLPVKRPKTSYEISRENVRPGEGLTFSDEDTFEFEFFPLPSIHVQVINCIFLEEAVLTDTIVYKSPAALRKMIDSYLTLEKPGFKLAIERPLGIESQALSQGSKGYRDWKTLLAAGCERPDYLRMLERVATELGSNCTAKFHLFSLDSIACVSKFPPGFAATYKRLGETSPPFFYY
jgi:hypothetical protein